MRRSDDRLTTADIEAEYGVPPATVWQWCRRGKLRPVGVADGRGSPGLFRRADVERARVRRRGRDVS